MIRLEDIRRIGFDAQDRSEVEARTIEAVQKTPEVFIKKYVADPRSFQGRYVSADLFKESFPEYARDPASRNRYNTPVHNSAAVLAGAQFRALLNEPGRSDADVVIFLTGVPGAGKTSGVMSATELPDSVRAIFEGQLANAETTMEKLQATIDAGWQARIHVAHARPENALINTLQRFYENGRGASINVMAQIQGQLPETLDAVHQRFGDKVDLVIRDVRDRANIRVHEGWDQLGVLRSEGNHDQIKQRLSYLLNRFHHNGVIDEHAYRQGAGKAPFDDFGRVGSRDRAQLGADEPGRGVPQTDRQADFLTRVVADSRLQVMEQIEQAGYIPRDAEAVKGPFRGDVIALSEHHAGLRFGTMVGVVVNIRDVGHRPAIGEAVRLERGIHPPDRQIER